MPPKKASSSGANTGAGRSSARRPNILIFMTDHQRADTVLPEHPCRTPNLDSFLKQSVAFTNTFCPSPHCCPSRATFFTGLYPTGHGVWNNVCNDMAHSRGLAPGVRLWSEDLAAAGYKLTWSGKWHLSVNEGPASRGWKELFVSAKAGDLHGATYDGYRKRAAQQPPAKRGEGQIMRPGWGTYTAYGSTGDGGQGHDERVVAEAVAALGQLAGQDQPWALYAGLIGPHDPYFVPQRYLDMYDIADVPLPPSFADKLDDKPRVYRRMRNMHWDQLTELETRQAIRHFWAYCTYLDDMFGRVLSALDATGQADNTLVLYVSDHGDYCGDHGLFTKGIPCFRGAYQVPAIIRWPAGQASPGRRVDEFVSLADFGPTFVELAGGTPSPALVGRSLAPFLAGSRPDRWRDEIHTQTNGNEIYFTQRSVMTREWKYVYNAFDNDELYDLKRDPHEMTNLAGAAAMEPVKREMAQRMWRFAADQNDAANNPYIATSLAPYGPAVAFEEPTRQRSR